MLPVCLYTPDTPICSATPICPQCSPMHLFVLGVSSCDMGCGDPHIGQPPRGQSVPPHVSNMSCMLPCIYVYSTRCLHVLWARHFLLGGVSIFLRLMVAVSTYIDVHYVHLVLSCSYYVSSFYYHGYDDYYSSDCGVFWYVIYIISDCGSLFDGASYSVGSAWCSPDTKMLWRCSWPCIHATAATSIFDASSGLCQLCHGFSTGSFLFQSWASLHLVYYMFGVCSGVCFLLSGALLDAIFTHWAQSLGFVPLQPLGVYPWQKCATCWWSLAHTRSAQSGCSLHYIE